MNKLIISAPFGNYFNVDGVTSTEGTFTHDKRAGFFKRWWRVLSTVRYNRRTQSWINKLGLPNPGFTAAAVLGHCGKIVSIHGFNLYEWKVLIDTVETWDPLAIELNLSCPNVTKTVVNEAIEIGKYCASRDFRYGKGKLKIIAKLPPIKWMDFVYPLLNNGINHFHLCNTIPTPGGGWSGKVLKPYSLWAVEEVKHLFGGVVVIGGGGVTGTQDIDDYLNAGADHISIASILLNPLNWKKIPLFRDYLHLKTNGICLVKQEP
jgi:dihydroorotate dehydrogenase